MGLINLDNMFYLNLMLRSDKEKKTLKLQAQNWFIKRLGKISNYLRYIEDAAKTNGLSIKGIKTR